MPMSEDSRALLTLLLGRGKSYADISGLLGVSEDEVRRRAASALAEVDPSIPAPDQQLTDYLVGQSDAIDRAEVGTRLSDDPALASQAEELTDQLRLLVPGATLPKPGSAEGGKPRPAAQAQAQPKTPAQPTESKSLAGAINPKQRRLLALLVGGALLAAVVILLVTGVFGGSDDGKDDKAQAAPTVAVMEPVAGQQGSGDVQFGFSGANFAANVQLSDLEPSKKNQGYVLWLYGSTGAFPINASRVDKSGAISGQITLNEAVICLIASDFFPTLRLSRVDNKEFDTALKQAQVKDTKNVKLPKYTGQTVLEGPISMPQSAKDQIVPVCNGSAQPQAE